MCLASMPEDACDDFLTDYDWMDRSGNVCWGMGAEDEIPCVNCGVEYRLHRMKVLYTQMKQHHERLAADASAL